MRMRPQTCEACGSRQACLSGQACLSSQPYTQGQQCCHGRHEKCKNLDSGVQSVKHSLSQSRNFACWAMEEVTSASKSTDL